MDIKQIFTVPVLVGTTVIAGAAGGTGYAVSTIRHEQPVKVEAVVKIDENKLSEKVAEKIIKHEQQLAQAEDSAMKVKFCRKNRDNEYYLRDHCKGVTF